MFLAVAPASASYVTVAGASDNFLSQTVDGSNKTFTLSQTPASTTTVWINLNNSLLSGASDYTLSGNTVTMATAPAASPAGTHNFYAAYLVQITTGSPISVAGAFDNFLSQTVDGSNKSFTLSQTPLSTATVWISLNNSLLSGASDYTLSGNTVTLTTAPAASPGGTHNFSAEYLVYSSTPSADSQYAYLDQAQTFTQAQTFQSSATASAFFGDGSHLTGVSPGNWTCTLRSGMGISPNGTTGTDTATCLTTEKVITGGCNWDNIFSTTTWSGAPTGQGFTCTGTTGAHSTMTAYANCCK